MWVENRSDELWLGVKGQSNLRIAGSLRNSFRASVAKYPTGVELRIWLEGLPAYSPSSNSEYRMPNLGSQSVGDKLHGQKGNNPDRRPRSQIQAKCQRKSDCSDSWDVGLEAAII